MNLKELSINYFITCNIFTLSISHTPLVNQDNQHSSKDRKRSENKERVSILTNLYNVLEGLFSGKVNLDPDSTIIL